MQFKRILLFLVCSFSFCLFFSVYFMCMNVLPACMFVSHIHECACGGQQRLAEPPGAQLQMIGVTM